MHFVDGTYHRLYVLAFMVNGHQWRCPEESVAGAGLQCEPQQQMCQLDHVAAGEEGLTSAFCEPGVASAGPSL